MANSLQDLLNKNKQKTETADTAETKTVNPFAALKKSTAQPIKHIEPTDSPLSKVATGTVTEKEAKELMETGKIKPTPTAAIPSLSDTSIAQSKPEEKLAKEFSFDSQSEGLDTEAMANLETALTMLQDNIEDKELVSEAVKNVLNLLNKHDFLKKILKPEDCGLMVRGLRNSYGTTIAKKEARGTKASASQAAVDEVADLLGDLGVKL